jgi:hypothetical protein
MMANTKIGRLSTVVALVFSVGLLLPAHSASAQSPNGSCRQARGNWFDSLNSTGGTTGIITRGGILNGTTDTVFDPAFVFTPDPNVVSYIAELTITTKHGQLKASNVYIYNFVTGLWTAMGRINADLSTGRFAGATGVLYFNGETVGVPPDQSYPSTITGKICFVNE